MGSIKRQILELLSKHPTGVELHEIVKQFYNPNPDLTENKANLVSQGMHHLKKKGYIYKKNGRYFITPTLN